RDRPQHCARESNALIRIFSKRRFRCENQDSRLLRTQSRSAFRPISPPWGERPRSASTPVDWTQRPNRRVGPHSRALTDTFPLALTQGRWWQRDAQAKCGRIVERKPALAGIAGALVHDLR